MSAAKATDPDRGAMGVEGVSPGQDAPFRHDGGPVGVLLCHGFTGSPASLRAWADHLAQEGFSVELPRLPGHGTTWQSLNRTAWPDWYRRVERSLLQLAQRCRTVVVAGLSMGGCLALRLAQQHRPLVHGLVLVNPAIASADRRLLALPVLRHVKPSVAALSGDVAKPGGEPSSYGRTPLHALYSLTRLWSLVRRDLARVTQPLLIYRSAVDHVVDPTSAALIRSGVSSTDITEVTLHRSYHVATVDYDASTIFAGTVAFARRLAPADQP